MALKRYRDDYEAGELSIGTNMSTNMQGQSVLPHLITIEYVIDKGRDGYLQGRLELGPVMAHQLMIELEDIFRRGPRNAL